MMRVFKILIVTLLSIALPYSGKGEIRKAYKMENGVPVYVIGVGDVLEVTLWEGLEPKKVDVEVKSDGSITVSFIDLKVDGLTVKEVRERLYKELKKFVREPRVDVKVKEYRSKKVTLIGAIQSQMRQPTGPGIYPLTGRITLSEMITRAGGFTPDADLSSIQITKRDGRTQVVNLFDLFFRGDLTKDIVLDDGDTVFIPRRVEVEKRIFIFGEVNRPGVYPLKKGTTLVQALGLAGGYKDTAVLKDIRVIRGGLESPELIATDVEAIIKKGEFDKDIALKDNDIIYVPRSRISNWNAFLAKIRPTLEFIILPFAGARVIDQVITGE